MEAQEVKLLTIKRAGWSFGKGNSKGKLLDSSSGLMCVLGYYAVSCGINIDYIKDETTPLSIPNLPDEMKWLRGQNGKESSDCASIAAINDNEKYDLHLREAMIQDRFLSNNVRVYFED